MYHSFTASGPFPSSPGPLYENEVKHSTFDMKMIFHSQANKTHFHKKGCALGLILKVRVFGIRKWPIRHFINEKGTGADRNATRNCFWDCFWERAGQPLANFFFPSLVTVPEVFSKIDSTQFPFCFLSGEFAISTFPIIQYFCVFLARQHTQTVLHTHCLHFSRNVWKPQKKMKIKLMQNCLRVLGGKKHANNVYYGKCGNDGW